MHHQQLPSQIELDTFFGDFQCVSADYIDFLREQNGGSPSPYILDTKDNQRVVNEFLAFKAPSRFYETIEKYLEVFAGRIPSHMLPIASAGGGDLLLIDTGENKCGSIYYWDHNFEMDADEMNAENADEYFENIELVANSFTELLKKLR